jgi:peptide/nickel transport system permease protein
VGRSREVADLIAPRLWNTLFLAGLTAIIAVPLSLFLGITSALYRNSIYDRAVSVTSLTTISFPEFFVAYVLILIFGSLWPVLPTLANVDASYPNGGAPFEKRTSGNDFNASHYSPYDAYDARSHY